VIRAVVDPSVFVSAFPGRPDAGPGRLVSAWREQRFALVVSPLLLEELAGVLARPKFERWASDGRAASYVAGFAARSENRPDPDFVEPSVRDPGDDYLVALARAETVDVLVSLDRELLDAGLEDLVVEDPATFVARLA
jgi:putative PIN family toxin of toxin-antitoxin system